MAYLESQDMAVVCEGVYNVWRGSVQVGCTLVGICHIAAASVKVLKLCRQSGMLLRPAPLVSMELLAFMQNKFRRSLMVHGQPARQSFLQMSSVHQCHSNVASKGL